MVLSLTRGGGAKKKLTADAEELKDKIAAAANTQKDVHDVVELVKAALRKATLASDDKNTETELDFDHFVKVVNEIMGIDDQALLRSLFDACDRDHSGSISASELSTLLFTFHRGDTDENRVRMM